MKWTESGCQHTAWSWGSLKLLPYQLCATVLVYLLNAHTILQTSSSIVVCMICICFSDVFRCLFQCSRLQFRHSQDLLVVMGVPSPGRKHVHHIEGLFSSDMPTFTERELKSLSGNGMHLAVVGVLLTCIIKNIEHVKPPTPPRPAEAKDVGVGVIPTSTDGESR